MARSRAEVLIEPEFDEVWQDEESSRSDQSPLRSDHAYAGDRPYPPDDGYRPTGASGGVPGRRTVTIRGQVAARPAPRRNSRGAYGGGSSRPDRIAMWAVLLGLLLVLVAATSSHAATLRMARGTRVLAPANALVVSVSRHSPTR